MSYQTQYHEEKYSPTESIQFELSDSPERLRFSSTTQTHAVEFVPRYYPERVIQDKERDLMREKGICLGEYVNDVGSKNREFRVSGKLITPELKDFHKVIDYGNKYDLICMQWQGEVLIEDSELEGPIGIDSDTHHWMYEYTLNLVSTGNDEQHNGDDGLINRGDS